MCFGWYPVRRWRRGRRRCRLRRRCSCPGSCTCTPWLQIVGCGRCHRRAKASSPIVVAAAFAVGMRRWYLRRHPDEETATDVSPSLEPRSVSHSLSLSLSFALSSSRSRLPYRMLLCCRFTGRRPAASLLAAAGSSVSVAQIGGSTGRRRPALRRGPMSSSDTIGTSESSQSSWRFDDKWSSGSCGRQCATEVRSSCGSWWLDGDGSSGGGSRHEMEALHVHFRNLR